MRTIVEKSLGWITQAVCKSAGVLCLCLSATSFADGKFYGPTITVRAPNQIVSLVTTLKVPQYPSKPNSEGKVLFLWPGLQPGEKGSHFEPIGNGVLQPVLTYGVSCAPTQQPKAFSSWWISAQYVNTLSSHKQYKGCFSGPSMLVNPGDELLIEFKLDQSTKVWHQSVRNQRNGKSVTFDRNLGGQEQNNAEFFIETYQLPFNAPVVFTNTKITAQHPQSGQWCKHNGDRHSVMSGASLLDNGRVCSISKISVTIN